MFAGLDAIGPAYNEGNAGTGIESAVLPTAVVLHGSMAVQQFACLVLIAVVYDGTVVTAEYKNGVVGNAEAVQSVEDDVATYAQTTLAGETRMWHAGNMYILRTHIKEERFVFMGCDEVLGLVCNHVGNVFVCPKGGFAAGHPADAGDAVDDGVIVPLAGFHLDEFGVFETGGPVTDLVVVAHSDRVVGVETHYMSVLYKDAGNAVDGSGDDVFIVKADVLGVRFDGVVEVCTAFRAQSEVPLTYCTGCIAFFLEHIGHSDAGGIDDEFGIARSDAGILLSPGIHARQQAETGRSAGGRSGISVGKLHALSGKAVNVGSAYFGGTVTAQVADTQVISNQIYYIGLLRRVLRSLVFRLASASRYQGCTGNQRPQGGKMLHSSLTLDCNSEVKGKRFYGIGCIRKYKGREKKYKPYHAMA